MSDPVPPPDGAPIEEPSNRWPWLALGAGLLVILIALGVFVLNTRQQPVATPTPAPTASPRRPFRRR